MKKMTEIEILNSGMSILATELDKHKIVHHMKNQERLKNNNRYDAVLELPDLKKIIVVEVKAHFHPGHIDKFLKMCGDGADSNVLPLVVTPYISESSYTYCMENNVNVIDFSGNIYLKLSDNPICFIERYRENKNAKPVRSAGSVFTARVTRLVRALLSSPGKEWTQKELIAQAGINAGYASVVLRQMKDEGYISITDSIIRLIEPNRMLDGWLGVYRYFRHKVQSYAVEAENYEQGLDKVAKSLKETGLRFAFTGQSGAYIRTKQNATDNYAVYVSKFPDETDGLVRVKSGGNVRLFVPQDEGVFQFTTENGRYGQVVSDAQLYLDLSKMPGKDIKQADDFRELKLKFE